MNTLAKNQQLSYKSDQNDVHFQSWCHCVCVYIYICIKSYIIMLVCMELQQNVIDILNYYLYAQKSGNNKYIVENNNNNIEVN